MITIVTILSILNLAGISVLTVLFLKSKKVDSNDSIIDKLKPYFDANDKSLKDEMSRNRKETADSGQGQRKELQDSLELSRKSLDSGMDRIRDVVEKRLESLQKNNDEKLDAMRVIVDEKLQATLEKRLGDNFKIVKDSLEQVHKGLGEMQTIAIGVGDLKKVLNNVKTRGTWGEAQLGNLIEEIFTPEQYEKNVKTKKNSKDNVEYAIKLPGSEKDKHVWLPIDAKFPLEDYHKLLDAQEAGNVDQIKEYGKALEIRIKSEARDIRDKYIDVPNTTAFGILFVPTESLYAEILRRDGLYETLRREYNVVITGPTTIQVILNSLNVGFKTLNIQKRSGEVWHMLSKVKTEFATFGGLLVKTQKKLQEAGNVIGDAIDRNRQIEKKLNKIEEPIGIDKSEEKIELPTTTLLETE